LKTTRGGPKGVENDPWGYPWVRENGALGAKNQKKGGQGGVVLRDKRGQTSFAGSWDAGKKEKTSLKNRGDGLRRPKPGELK